MRERLDSLPTICKSSIPELFGVRFFLPTKRRNLVRCRHVHCGNHRGSPNHSPVKMPRVEQGHTLVLSTSLHSQQRRRNRWVVFATSTLENPFLHSYYRHGITLHKLNYILNTISSPSGSISQLPQIYACQLCPNIMMRSPTTSPYRLPAQRRPFPTF
jgi:hypothetical protein